jgi:peptide/nickel transport system substrate-binding protein
MPNAPLRRRHTLAAFTAAAASMILLAGCTASDPNAAPATGSADTSIVVAYRNEVTTIDPARSDYVQTDSIDQTLYDTLVTFDADNALAPSLATSFEYNDTVDAISVTLRDDVLFHDGAPLTSADVKYSLDRYKALGVGIFGQIKNYDSTEIIDDQNLVIHLSTPDSLALGALSRVYIVNSALVSANEGSDNAQSYLLSTDAGSGPYTLGEASGGTYTLARFDDYFGFDEERPNTLTMRRIDEYATIRDELTAGTVDVGPIAPTDEETLTQAGLEVAKRDSYQAYVFFNNSVGQTANPAVREAIRLAYDYQGGLDNLRDGQGTIANGPLPSSLSCRPELPSSEQNLEQAKKVLSDAGLSDLTLTLDFQPAFAEQAQEATLLQSNLAEIGVTLNLEPIAFADYLNLLSDFSTIPEMMLATEAAPYPDAGVMLTRLFLSSAVGTNKMAYSNPEVDSLLADANAEPDADTRCDYYMDAQTIIDEDNAIMPMYTVTAGTAHRPDIAGAELAAPNGSLSIASLTVNE